MSRITFRGLITVSVLLILLCVPSIASADGVTWDLTASFDDRGSASGSFFYDAGANKFSAIHITTTPGTAFAGTTYTSLSGVFGSSNTGMLLGASSGDLTDTDLLFLMFGLDLTKLGGTVPLIGVGEGTCDNADCSLSTEDRAITTGDVVATVVTPEPSTFLLLGMGLVALLAGLARRKVSHA